ncbi:TetR/AcrR family transcriptional regulator [Nocardia sp. NPDC058058]|uniref:TetR/AcrR family transcriptional regulator n=1 Tax=Nocardia sp. NPDC058058 TaxID=3346317 RepID=UPI0036D7D66A
MPSMPDPAAGTVTRRAERRAATVAEIKAHARRQLATEGTGGLSLRGIARSMRMSPAALFRYFDSQTALITALCVDAYDALNDSITEAQSAADPDPAAQWRTLCLTTRRWALDHSADFALINGTPIPGFEARPEDTGPAAGRLLTLVSSGYIAAIASGAADPAATQVPPLATGPLLNSLLGTDSMPDSPIPGIVLNGWASILGFIAAEVFGSLGTLIADPDALYDAHLRTVMHGMGFTA